VFRFRESGEKNSSRGEMETHVSCFASCRVETRRQLSPRPLTAYFFFSYSPIRDGPKASPVITPSAHENHANERGQSHQANTGLETEGDGIYVMKTISIKNVHLFGEDVKGATRVLQRYVVSRASALTGTARQFPLDGRGGCLPLATLTNVSR
jgi:hypothetical protein